MILRHYSITETRELLTTLRGVSETLKQLHFDDTTSAIFVDDEPAHVALPNHTSRDSAEITHMNSDEEINDYRKNSLRPNIYIYIYTVMAPILFSWISDSDPDHLFIILCDHFPDPDSHFVTRYFPDPDPDPKIITRSRSRSRSQYYLYI